MRQIVEIRDYTWGDGIICYDLRRSAFLNVFSKNLSPTEIRAGADAYRANEFADRIGGMETYVATIGGDVAGFCTIRVDTSIRAEILYLYINSGLRGIGVGSQLLQKAERRVLESHPKLTTLYLDTVVPGYNQGFWERMGYRYTGPSTCNYPGGTIPATRLEKILANQHI